MITADNLLQRIDTLLKLKAASDSYEIAGEVYFGAVSIATQLYGAGSQQVNLLKQLRDSPGTVFTFTREYQGVLQAIASDIRDGRLGSLLLDYQGQVFADFVNAAKAALSEDSKEVAAVLACAALEDALKRFAEANGLDVEDKSMTDVINVLKSAGLVSKQQGTLLKGMVPLRNKALHAEWSRVDKESVRGVIGFVEHFLVSKFGQGDHGSG